MVKIGLGILFLFFSLSLTAQEPDSTSANEYFKQSVYALKEKNFERCRSLALKALEVDSTFGKAYIIIGNAYIESREQCFNEYELKSVIFCLAVDKFVLAKKVDSSLTDQCNELIRVYSRYFPSREEIYSDIRSGERYKIDCWINEETIIRFYEDIK